MFEIRRVDFSKHLDEVLSIYHEYVNSTSVSLDFQGNTKEFDKLYEKYKSPEVGIYLAWDNDDKVVACAAYRKVDHDICEMKRVYVRPSARGHRLGLKLVERVLQEARASGYKKICLDVLPEFETALALYLSLGFKPDKPITYNPVPGTAFLSLELNKAV